MIIDECPHQYRTMRLLKVDERGELGLTEDLFGNIPSSHTWGVVKDEVTFEVIRTGASKNKAGYGKIQFCWKQARKNKLEYV